MQVCSSFTISPVSISKDELDKLYRLVSDCIQNGSVTVGNNSITVKEEFTFVWVEEIGEDLAVRIAKLIPDMDFSIDGTVSNWSTSEYMDFLIEYKNKTLTSRSSVWYQTLIADEYEDYDDFSEYYLDDDDEPLFTEDEYNSFVGRLLYLVDDGTRVVEGIVLKDPLEISIQ